MWERFFPDQYYDSIFEIPYKELQKKGIEALIFDVDNTLVEYRMRRPLEKTSNLLARLKKMGFKVALLTNNSKHRLTVLNENMKLPAYHKSMKPFRGKAKKALQEMGVEPAKTAIIGDQLLTDIWCGNRLKTETILVKPLSKRDLLSVRMKRGIENMILRAYLAEREKKQEP